MIVNIDFENARLCHFCKKRIATKLCDAPTMILRYIGHPPKENMKMKNVMSCDLPMCDRCATKIINGVDYCPKCMKEIKQK